MDSPLDVLSVVCRHRLLHVAPDSERLTMPYYRYTDAPIGVASTGAAPPHGVIDPGDPSPDPQPQHRAILAPDPRIENIIVNVLAAPTPLLRMVPDRRKTPFLELEPG